MYLFSDKLFLSEQEIYFAYTSKLGQLYKQLPLEELSKLLPVKRSRKGAPSWLDNKGMIALMFLKSYTGASDRSLIRQLNCNFEYQLFCGISLKPGAMIADENLASRVRGYVSKHLDMKLFQQTLLQYWKPQLKDTHVALIDATVFESYIKYPTDVKLLWDCCNYIYHHLDALCHLSGTKMGKSTWLKTKSKVLTYQKQRKKTHKQTQKIKKSLLTLLKRLLALLEPVLGKYYQGSLPFILPKDFSQKLKTVKEIYTQQYYLYTHPGSSLSDRIVSLHKPYVRAIVRGKENKSVEFGAKVHIVQTDGINYIQHLSYKPFNENQWLKSSVFTHRQYFGQCTHLAADGIYPTNANRRFCTAQGIYTNFEPKGPKTNNKEEQQIKAALAKERSTRLEGSFGNEKANYGLQRVKAGKQETEILLIYFAVMTANAKLLATRQIKALKRAA